MASKVVVKSFFTIVLILLFLSLLLEGVGLVFALAVRLGPLLLIAFGVYYLYTLLFASKPTPKEAYGKPCACGDYSSLEEESMMPLGPLPEQDIQDVIPPVGQRNSSGTGNIAPRS